MFEPDLFRVEFPEHIRKFALERGVTSVRVVVVTVAGERIDIQSIFTSDSGARLVTRNDEMIFLPYHQIAHIVVSVPQERGDIGFQIPAESAA